MRRLIWGAVLLVFPLVFQSAAPGQSSGGQWLEGQWQYRRSLEVNWDSEHATGHELAIARFYTAGPIAPAGADVRVSTSDGRVIPSHVLDVGPGDQVCVVFAPVAGQTRYFAYFGNPDAPPPPAGTEDVKYECGLLMEMRQFASARLNSPEDLASTFASATTIIGKTLIPQPFYGLDPFGEHQRVITKLTGSLVIPVDGDYFLASSVDGRGAIFLDGKAVLFVPGRSGDVKFNATVHLSRGRHEFVMYAAHSNGQGAFSVGWERPGIVKPEVMPRNVFGSFSRAKAGALEQRGQKLVADFDMQYEGECFLANNYSHRCLFTASVPAGASTEATYDWDFGDGVTATGREIEHVFVTSGDYSVKITAHVGANSAARTVQLHIDRDWENLDNPVEDPALKQARVVAKYDAAKVPDRWLPWMWRLERQALLTDAAMAAAARMVALPKHFSRDAVLDALNDLSHDLVTAKRTDEAANLWDHVPADSDLQPMAAVAAAQLLLWGPGDFSRALKITDRFAASDDARLRRIRAQALVLSGQADEGRKILQELSDNQEKIGPTGQTPGGSHPAAMSGASARTVEARINERDWQTGEDDWETWAARSPLDFMEGYSIDLRISLMELKGASAGAAKIAEAFATAVPDSPYSPMLLHRASLILIKSDPAKSKELRDELKSRYPEDPLSQQ